VRLAAVQMAPGLKQPVQNLWSMTSLVMLAAAQKAELIVLPELATSGYSFMSALDVAPYAEVLVEGQGTLQHFRTLSTQLDVAIVWGMPVRDGDLFHNAQIMVMPDGSWIKCYKLNSWGNDFLWSTPGKESPPITTWRGKKIGLLICRDIRDKSSGFKDFYEKGDADIVAFSSNFGDGGFPSTSWMDFAKSNQVTLVVSNRYGRETCNNFGEGGVCIIDPPGPGQEYGTVHCDGLVWDQDCVVLADLV